jgi:hypothetical protein
MEEAIKRNLISRLKERYASSSKHEKGKILSQVELSLGVCRRQARRLLGSSRRGRPRKKDGRGRPGVYRDAEFVNTLRRVWKESYYMCSRHLKSSLAEWLPAIERTRGYQISPEVRDRLYRISAASIDRVLAPYKGAKGISTTHPGKFRDQIPIQTSVWDQKIPGYFEADTVAHCGGSIGGEYIHTVTLVDIATLWTETRAIYGKGSTAVVHAIEDIEDRLPIEILGYDSDNGTEILNQHILKYFTQERVERNRKVVQITRSRPYMKNDNAHIEQRNNSVARRWLGYERLDFSELQPLVNYYFAHIVCPLINHFFPVFKLEGKIRRKSRTKRVYSAPKTPYQRVMESPLVSEARKNLLKKQHESLNPIVLADQERVFRKKIDLALRELKRGQATGGLFELPPVPPAVMLCLAPSPTPPMLAPPSPGASPETTKIVLEIASNSDLANWIFSQEISLKRKTGT